MEFAGRRDRQLKIRGFRVELDEIETVLGREPEIESAAVIARGDGPSRTLAAFVVARGALDESRRSALLARLAARLPGYMLPALEWVESLPRTATGKVDRKQLEQRETRALLVGPRSAPSSPREFELAALFARVLERPEIGVTDDFFALGGDSLRSAVLLVRLERELGVRVRFAEFVADPTVRGVLAAESARAAPGKLPLLTLTTEAASAETLQPVTPAGTFPARPECVLVTGATGFVGAFLLAELVRRTDAQIVALVRAPDRTSAARRLRERLEFFELWEDGFTDRVRAVPGDLAAPELGLPAAEHERLADAVDAVFHAGAFVHHLAPYVQLKPANVDGTLEVLKFAATARPKAVHFISTLSIWAHGLARGGRIDERTELPAEHSPTHGYASSKWAAEGLVRAASRRGLACRVYRLAYVTSARESGACNPDDLLFRLLRTCAETGSSVDIGRLFESAIAPEDAARAVVALALAPRLDQGVFHLGLPVAYGAAELVQAFAERALPKLGPERWLGLLERSLETEPLPFAPYLPIVREMIAGERDLGLPEIGHVQTLDCLGALGLRLNPLQASELGRARQFLERRGLAGRAR